MAALDADQANAIYDALFHIAGHVNDGTITSLKGNP